MARPGTFKKGNDPRRHLLGRKKSPKTLAKLNRIDQFKSTLKGSEEEIALLMVQVILTGEDNVGVTWPPSVRLKVLEEYNKRLLGLPEDPNRLGGNAVTIEQIEEMDYDQVIEQVAKIPEAQMRAILNG